MWLQALDLNGGNVLAMVLEVRVAMHFKLRGGISFDIVCRETSL